MTGCPRLGDSLKQECLRRDILASRKNNYAGHEDEKWALSASTFGAIFFFNEE